MHHQWKIRRAFIEIERRGKWKRWEEGEPCKVFYSREGEGGSSDDWEWDMLFRNLPVLGCCRCCMSRAYFDTRYFRTLRFVPNRGLGKARFPSPPSKKKNVIRNSNLIFQTLDLSNLGLDGFDPNILKSLRICHVASGMGLDSWIIMFY